MEGEVIKTKIDGRFVVYGAFGNGENCTGVVERIDEPEEGGIFTKYYGCNYFFKGYPNSGVIREISVAKKALKYGFRLVEDKGMRFFLGFMAFFFFFFSKKLKAKIILSLADYILSVSYHNLEEFVLLPIKYCVSVKEFGRAITDLFNKHKKNEDIYERIRRVIELGRNIVCMILEYDYAYKARWQDVFQYIDKGNVKKNVKKEVLRILRIMIDREVKPEVGVNGMVYKWNNIISVLKVCFLFRPVRNITKELLLDIDFDKIKPDEADFYYVCDRDDYNYSGLNRDERMKIAKELDEKVGNKRPKITFVNKKEDLK